MLNKELVNYQNKLYYIFKRVRQNHIKEGFVNDVKEWWKCDVVLKSKHQNDDNLLFLREIEDAIIVS